MSSLSYFGKKLQHLCSTIFLYLACLCRSACFLISCLHKSILLRVNKIFVQIFYFIFISLFGFCILRILKPRSVDFTPRNLDLFFISVSSVTVSSMSTVEMEVFSNSQLILITFLMFIGGEIFTSMVGLHLIRSKFKPWRKDSKIESVISSTTTSPRNSDFNDDIELDIVVIPDSPKPKSENDEFQDDFGSSDKQTLKYQSIKFLGFVTLVYLLVINIIGVSSVLVYLACVSSAKDVLRNKGLKTFTFAIFTVVSTFASCGFVPTNENMMVFSKNSGLLLILIPQVLFGNTLYPACLRLCIKFLGKFSKKREAKYLLKHSREIRHLHLLPSQHSRLLVITVFGFILIQLIMFCSLEWKSSSLNGLNSYQKIVGSLFQVVNARHTGETIVDISTVAPAILVVFIVMMYLPPYTSFIPVKGVEETPEETVEEKQGRGKVAENLILSQLSYIIFFIVLICITERKRTKDDPFNFNVLNITLEVVSAYGNVGFTTGYSCDRMINRDTTCKNKTYGFVGKWSDEGKLILIIVMFFGRLKKFNMQGGKAWKLL
ncbi:sodium transporter HKT1-like [Nicotiana tabacum]|uniref:Sodium transporter HKT1-like n=1 Tax=Nicotiana tabacum TaxID=4097 RepID=A0A1S4AWX5_TOBAC|nr:PREDICTED: sodium transporter HKT1-like [Nicotiana tabacum]